MKDDQKILALGTLLALVLWWKLLWPAAPATAPAAAPARLEEGPLVALTFDDGPQAGTTDVLLDGLRERGAEATFFLIGEQLKGNEDLVRRMAEEGHQVGIHTWGHVGLSGLNDRDFYLQVGRMEEALKDLTGQEQYAVRPPYGYVDAGVERRVGAPIYLWSIDPEDWKYRETGRVAEHVVERAKDGDIILLHDIYPTSVRAALDIVDALQARGFRFVTVDELARARGVAPQAGKVYRSFRSGTVFAPGGG